MTVNAAYTTSATSVATGVHTSAGTMASVSDAESADGPADDGQPAAECGKGQRAQQH